MTLCISTEKIFTHTTSLKRNTAAEFVHAIATMSNMIFGILWNAAVVSMARNIC